MIDPLTGEKMSEQFTAMAHRYGSKPKQIVFDFSVEHGVSVADLIGPRRFREIVHPRQDLFRILREHTSLSLTAIGRIFGRDHSTVLHGIRASEARAAGRKGSADAG